MSAHLGPMISALLDGELGPDEIAEVEAHLGECAECRAERDAIAHAKAMVQSLPMLDPPFGFIDRIVLTERKRARAAASKRPVFIATGAAAAAAFVLLALVPGQERTVKPPVANFVEAHATTISSNGDSVTRLAPVAVPVSFGR